MAKKSALKVTLTFSRAEIKEILTGTNAFGLRDGEKPITVNEVLNTPRMKKYLTSELQLCVNEIVDGSYEATANDWLCDITNYRKKK